jgi:hypothetical protein
MKRRIKIFGGCALLFLLGGGIGYLLRVPWPASGGGQYRESPDGKWQALANTLDDGSVLGPHRRYYEFVIRTPPPASRTVRRMRIEDGTKPPIDWREEGNILWATNSSAVTFKCDARKTSLEITLRIEPRFIGLTTIQDANRQSHNQRKADELMKVFLAIRYGHDESPDGPNGEDTLFVVRAGDRDGAAAIVDEYLASALSHERVEPVCHRLVELGDDSSANLSAQILYGPWYALGLTPPGYKTWAREVHTNYRWVDQEEWLGGHTADPSDKPDGRQPK